MIKSIDKYLPLKSVNTRLFAQILNTLDKLKCLKFDSLLFYDQRMSVVYSPPMIFSSSLLELHVIVDSFDDCLYLLDGRLNQLQIFYVDVQHSFTRPGLKEKKVYLHLRS